MSAADLIITACITLILMGDGIISSRSHHFRHPLLIDLIIVA